MISMVLYVLCVVLANVLAARWIIPIGFGLMVPAGVFMIAPIFTLRDYIHKKYGYKTSVVLIFAASIISYLLSIVMGSTLLSMITIASVISFLISELIDTFIYHKLDKDAWLSKVMKSNLVSALIDSVLFISIAFGFILPLILGQYIVKVVVSYITGLVIVKMKKV